MDESQEETYPIPILDDLDDVDRERFHGVLGASPLASHPVHAPPRSDLSQRRNGYAVVSPSSLGASHAIQNSSLSLPILRAVEIVPPVLHTDYLSALIHSDPRVAFDTLHMGLMEYIAVVPFTAVRPNGERKRQRTPTAVENDVTRRSKSSLQDSVSLTSPTTAPEEVSPTGISLSSPSTTERPGYHFVEEDERNNPSPLPSLTSATVRRNATSDLVVEVLPLHQMVSERDPFKVNFDEVEKVLQASKKKDIETLIGASFLTLF